MKKIKFINIIKYSKSIIILTSLLIAIFLIPEANSQVKKSTNDKDLNISEINNKFNIYKTNKALVILDDWMLTETHSLFWSQIKSLNYELEFKMVDDLDIKLDYFGEKLYDLIVLCIPSYTDEDSKDSVLSVKKIIKYFDEGHNIMIIADKYVNSYIRSLSTEFGIDFDDYDSQVKDSLYLHNNKKNLNPDLLKLNSNEITITKGIIPIKNVFRPANNFVLYEGIGLEIDSHNSYVFPILKADENTYSVNSKGEVFYNVGEKIKLVAGYQGRNNKRVSIIGSNSLCSNKFYYLSMVDNGENESKNVLNSANAILCQDIINWNFQKTGVLMYDNIKHHKLPEEVSLERYRIKDEIEYMIDIYEYDYKTDSWKPYLTDDLQIVFSMMDPFYRIQMKMLAPNKPTYYTSFKVR